MWSVRCPSCGKTEVEMRLGMYPAGSQCSDAWHDVTPAMLREQIEALATERKAREDNKEDGGYVAAVVETARLGVCPVCSSPVRPHDCDRECTEVEPDYGTHGYDTVRDERMEGLR